VNASENCASALNETNLQKKMPAKPSASAAMPCLIGLKNCISFASVIKVEQAKLKND
jgi:hypothetical protein